MLFRRGSIIDAARVNVFAIIRDEKEPIPLLAERWERLGKYEGIKGDAAFYYNRGGWIEIPNNGKNFFSVDSVYARNRAYIRTRSSGIIEISKAGISHLEIPAQCEAIASSAAGRLVASFRGLGVFELREDWQRLLNVPYPQVGHYEVHLAVDEEHVALALTPKDIGTEPVALVWDTSPGLWISSGHEWRKFSFPDIAQPAK